MNHILKYFFSILFYLPLILFPSIHAQQPPNTNELNHRLAQMWHKPGTPETLTQLLDQGANPNFIIDTYYDDTLLDKLAYNDTHNELLKILIARNSRINKQKFQGNYGTYSSNSSALHHAAIGGAPQNTLALLNAGADIHSHTSFYDTPLHLLIQYAQSAKLSESRKPLEWPLFLETAKIFIAHGARLDIAAGKEKPRPQANSSPLQLVINLDLPEFVELFRKKIAEVTSNNLHELQQTHDNYVSLLPIDLLPEISYMLSNDEFIAQQKGRP